MYLLFLLKLFFMMEMEKPRITCEEIEGGAFTNQIILTDVVVGKNIK